MEETAQTNKEKELTANGSSDSVGLAEQPKQSKEENRIYAQKRREEETKKLLKQTRKDAILEVLKVNPYTNEEMTGDEDIEKYLLMKQIEKDGKNPLSDYHQYVGTPKPQSLLENASDDIRADETFCEFIRSFQKNDVKTLYETFGKLVEHIAQKEKEKILFEQAKERSSTGPLGEEGHTQGALFFSKEQVQKMSREEIKRHYDEIRRSQQKW